MKHQPLHILFAGAPANVTFRDGSRASVFVHELPDRYLGLVLLHAEERNQLIELCTLLAKPHKFAPAFPQVPVPHGYHHVPAGWADNLSDASIETLAALAESLNFSRAMKKGQALIIAKKRIEPLFQATVQQVVPLIQGVVSDLMNAASNSRPNLPSSPAPAARKR